MQKQGVYLGIMAFIKEYCSELHLKKKPTVICVGL